MYQIKNNKFSSIVASHGRLSGITLSLGASSTMDQEALVLRPSQRPKRDPILASLDAISQDRDSAATPKTRCATTLAILLAPNLVAFV